MINENKVSNFIRNIIIDDIKNGKNNSIITRFPPEPNGYLHIGHAKSLEINFSLAYEFNGKVNLRFDDTNPVKEDTEYVESIKKDIEWLGYKWDKMIFASDYFEIMYEKAILLIKKGLAYVCDLSGEEIKKYRGTLQEPGVESPYRNRSVEENLDLFYKMRNAEFKDGEKVLRAKIDMLSSNINMRDPIIYRISHTSHHNTGNKWCIYPMYDFAHPIEDAIEGITYSICTLEFEDHRPLYDWFVNACEMENIPRQIEFARLNLTNTVMSKRKLKALVDNNIVDGWDDPRMPTISGFRRRGFTPESIRNFCRAIGVSKANSLVDYQMLEYFLREDLNLKCKRIMAVIDPIKVVITNYEEGKVEELFIDNNKDDESMGMRKITFSKYIYIDRDDFMENPPPKYFRLFKGNEVRLKGAYFIKCNDVIKDENGKILELHCTYDPETKSGSGFTGRKVKGTIHFIDSTTAMKAQFRLFKPLLLDEENTSDNFLDNINKDSLEIFDGFIENNARDSVPYEKYQIFRHGYFSVDPKYTTQDKLVFNRVTPLKSSFKLDK
ncbi:glutamine--tRNA ligase/YqeY domain fusion protein [Candidatus Arthromitus sp. SFB-rat-Yit]|uniref:glutamine--tRNA ligase/YqeY domain fusion protein n=1 Tax=Candidatus Arthromitus sp. SFB-rat-Yit TaxID=1041504 RepID=UPI000227A05E|nr:glutamine--tRNA ligase/YqeY domain fusion protein [Candidatus Arthromitus sp. SFB-rat-Yit]BAK80738.1 glutaminyl-tRNA synthetase [Candidatus Arthromitus sp. SFB-rat-Yit]